MKMSRSLFYLSLLIVSIACQDSEDETIQSNFIQDFRVGQKIHYVQLYGFNEIDSIQTRNSGDTLELDVLEIGENYAQLSERYTLGSNSVKAIEYLKEPHTSKWFIEGDSLLIIKDSVNWVDSNYLTSKNKLILNGNSISELKLGVTLLSYIPKTDGYYYVKDCTIMHQYYERLDVFADMSPLSYDGYGEVIFFSIKSGIVRVIRIYPRGGIISWDRM